MKLSKFDLLVDKSLKNKDNNVRALFFIPMFLVLLLSFVLFSLCLQQLVFADSVISTIQLGGNPASTGTQDEILFNQENANAYIINPALNFGWGGVSVIDTQNNTVTENITIMDIPNSLFGSPVEIALDPENNNLYVSSLVALVDFNAGELVDERCDNRFSSTPCVVSVIDTQNNTLVKTIPIGVRVLPSAIAFNPDNGDMYVVNERTVNGTVSSKTVSVIDTQNNTLVKTIPIGNFTIDDIPTEIAYNPNNGDMYVVNEANERMIAGNGSISVIDAQNNTVSQNIPVGEGALRIAFNHDNGNMYVTNVVDNTISVIAADSNTRVK